MAGVIELGWAGIDVTARACRTTRLPFCAKGTYIPGLPCSLFVQDKSFVKRVESRLYNK
jgi:hypothetical protein